jgi:hypothetical protein
MRNCLEEVYPVFQILTARVFYLVTLLCVNDLQMWEMGIELCKDLTLQYETETFEYTQLSTILVRFFLLFVCMQCYSDCTGSLLFVYNLLNCSHSEVEMIVDCKDS